MATTTQDTMRLARALASVRTVPALERVTAEVDRLPEMERARLAPNRMRAIRRVNAASILSGSEITRVAAFVRAMRRERAKVAA